MVTHKLDLVKNFNKTVKIEKAGLKIYNKQRFIAIYKIKNEFKLCMIFITTLRKK